MGLSLAAPCSLSTLLSAKGMERTQRQNQAITSAVLAAAFDAIITIDHRGVVVEWNSAAERLFGYARSEAVGREMAELIIPPQLREGHRAGMMNYLANSAGANPQTASRTARASCGRDGVPS